MNRIKLMILTYKDLLSDKISPEEQIANVIEHIEDYQYLVDKNRETAERLGSWDVRMKWLMGELSNLYMFSL